MGLLVFCFEVMTDECPERNFHLQAYVGWWLCRHRHLPLPIYKAAALRRTITEAARKKEERRKAHSAPGSISTKPLRTRRIIKVEWAIYKVCAYMVISYWIRLDQESRLDFHWQVTLQLNTQSIGFITY